MLNKARTLKLQCWSDGLIAETRKCIFHPPISVGSVLCMKNLNGQFGQITVGDLLAEKWAVRDRQSDQIFSYHSGEEMIDAGWVID